MIIPIGHDQQIRRLPWVTIGIIAACTLVQLYSTFAAPGVADLERLDSPAAVDALLDRIPIWRLGYHTDGGSAITLVTSAFVHAGWFHLIGNMLFLWLAGSVLEDRWGGVKYLAFYVGSAVVANLVFKALYHGPGTILVGASGAISGAMGAFLVYYATTKITFMYWLMMRTGTFVLAAYYALPLWIGEQILWAYFDHQSGDVSGVAYGAHIGGFAFGAGLALVTRMVFGRRDHDSDDPPIPAATALPSDDSERDRFDRCVEAISRKNLSTVRTLASRTILDLSRAGDEARIVKLYKLIDANLPAVPLTEGAFVVVASTADAIGDADLYVRVANAFDRERPGSLQLPAVLWRLAEHHRDAGRIDEAVATLESLATRFPHDSRGVKAREALSQRS